MMGQCKPYVLAFVQAIIRKSRGHIWAILQLSACSIEDRQARAFHESSLVAP